MVLSRVAVRELSPELYAHHIDRIDYARICESVDSGRKTRLPPTLDEIAYIAVESQLEAKHIRWIGIEGNAATEDLTSWRAAVGGQDGETVSIIKCMKARPPHWSNDIALLPPQEGHASSNTHAIVFGPRLMVVGLELVILGLGQSVIDELIAVVIDAVAYLVSGDALLFHSGVTAHVRGAAHALGAAHAGAGPVPETGVQLVTAIHFDALLCSRRVQLTVGRSGALGKLHKRTLFTFTDVHSAVHNAVPIQFAGTHYGTAEPVGAADSSPSSAALTHGPAIVRLPARTHGPADAGLTTRAHGPAIAARTGCASVARLTARAAGTRLTPLAHLTAIARGHPGGAAVSQRAAVAGSENGSPAVAGPRVYVVSREHKRTPAVTKCVGPHDTGANTPWAV